MQSSAQVLFGRKMRATRKAARVSREIAAERAEITASYLGEVERGEKWPALDIICAIAAALGVSASTFFEFEAQEADPTLLRRRLHRIVENRTTAQQQQAFRVLKALFEQ
jgi:transcriptional regulator with XRE-family HTH domain